MSNDSSPSADDQSPHDETGAGPVPQPPHPVHPQQQEPVAPTPVRPLGQSAGEASLFPEEFEDEDTEVHPEAADPEEDRYQAPVTPVPSPRVRTTPVNTPGPTPVRASIPAKKAASVPVPEELKAEIAAHKAAGVKPQVFSKGPAPMPGPQLSGGFKRPLSIVRTVLPWVGIIAAVIVAIVMMRRAQTAETKYATLLEQQQGLELAISKAEGDVASARIDLDSARAETEEALSGTDVLRERIAANQTKQQQGESAVAEAQATVSEYEEQLLAIVELTDHLESQGALGQAEMVRLNPVLPAYSRLDAVIAWDAPSRHGRIRWASAPDVVQGFTYQLWALDAEGNPVGALVLPNEDTVRSFEVGEQSLGGQIASFAVTVEPYGGSEQPSEAYVLQSEALYVPPAPVEDEELSEEEDDVAGDGELLESPE